LPTEPPQVPVDGIPAVRFNASEPETDLTIRNGKYEGKNTDRSDHLYKNGVFHIYTDEKGSAEKEAPLYIPNGGRFVKSTRKTNGEYQSLGEWQNEFVTDILMLLLRKME
jgi:hypothetical protein